MQKRLDFPPKQPLAKKFKEDKNCTLTTRPYIGSSTIDTI
jgi:hypothetical protein